METNFNQDDQKVTAKGRRLRLDATIQEVKKNKTMPKDDVVRFIMNKFWMSRRIGEIYVQELVDCNKLKLTSKPEGDYIEYIGEE